MAKLLSVIATLFVVGVPLNFLWEVAQMPLYVEGGKLLEFAVHCIFPSLGDGVIVLLTFTVGWAVLRRSDWFDRPGLSGYALMIFTGLVIAVVVEWVAVYFIDRWSYTASMPQLPGLGVGLSPVLQMLVLPPVIFKVTAWWLGRRQS